MNSNTASSISATLAELFAAKADAPVANIQAAVLASKLREAIGDAKFAGVLRAGGELLGLRSLADSGASAPPADKTAKKEKKEKVARKSSALHFFTGGISARVKDRLAEAGLGGGPGHYAMSLPIRTKADAVPKDATREEALALAATCVDREWETVRFFHVFEQLRAAALVNCNDYDLRFLQSKKLTGKVAVATHLERLCAV